MTKHGLTLVQRMILHGKQNPKTMCVEWVGSLNQQGYGKVRVGNESRLVTRIWWKLMTGVDPGRLHVLHKCDNPACFNIDHLHLGTQNDNIKDCMKKGRFKKINESLDETIAEQAKRLLKTNRTIAQIAEELGIGETSVARIRDKDLYD